MFPTVGNAYIVCKLGFRQGERFRSIGDAKLFAEQLAKREPNQTIEIFECKYNLAAELPVIYYGDEN